MLRHSTHRFTWIASTSLLAAGLGVQVVLAASSPPSTPKSTPGSSEQQSGQKSWQDRYEEGVDLAKSEKYAEARQVFTQLEVEQPKNPEILNMLAYTQRKSGDVDSALENYRKALRIKPKFPQAREYLGEAYLQAALREAETLQGYGEAGAEDLGKLADAFQEAASSLEARRSKDGKKAAKW